MKTEMPRVRVCPYCQTILDRQETCVVCGEAVPMALTQEGIGIRLLPMPTLGWPGHGRSSYLTALMYLLTRLNMVWPNCSYRELSQRTRKFLTQAHQLCHTGELPARTPKDKQQRLLLLLKNVSQWGDFVLALEDCAGHHFSGSSVASEQQPFLLRSPCALLMISPVDLERGDWHMVDMLLNTYLETIELNGLDPAQPPRGLVITLSKADLLYEQLPGELQRYLKSDVLSTILRPRKALLSQDTSGQGFSFGDKALVQYLAEMTDIDRELRTWLGEDPHFRNLQLKAEQYQIETRYSLVSSLGEPPTGKKNTLPTLWRPRRVLDPFFWFLELESKLGGTESFITELQRHIESMKSFSLVVTDTRSPAKSKRVDLRNSSGSLEPLSPELADLSFCVESHGVLFETQWQGKISVRRQGTWGDETADRFLLEPEDALRVDDWEIQVNAGFFQS